MKSQLEELVTVLNQRHTYQQQSIDAVIIQAIEHYLYRENQRLQVLSQIEAIKPN